MPQSGYPRPRCGQRRPQKPSGGAAAASSVVDTQLWAHAASPERTQYRRAAKWPSVCLRTSTSASPSPHHQSSEWSPCSLDFLGWWGRKGAHGESRASLGRVSEASFRRVMARRWDVRSRPANRPPDGGSKSVAPASPTAQCPRACAAQLRTLPYDTSAPGRTWRLRTRGW
eukprot:scaffold278409_cov35-Tisochrysis_lutea.AAC.1